MSAKRITALVFIFIIAVVLMMVATQRRASRQAEEKERAVLGFEAFYHNSAVENSGKTEKSAEEDREHAVSSEKSHEDELASDRDLLLLARIISAEARGEPYIGQVAVGAVIMNRVLHPSFPDSIEKVIYQKGAFSALSDGQFDLPVSKEAIRAAREVLSGANPVSDAVFFYNPNTATDKWIRSRPVVIKLGQHVFCT